MKVVTKAMITIMENNLGEITPRSRPTFNITSSTRPRVFMSTPTENALLPTHPTGSPC